jgi:small subunit ribosomal protein S9
MEILARAVGRRKEAVAQVQLIRGTGQLIINSKPAHEYLQNDSCAILSVQAPFEVLKKNGAIKTNNASLAEENGSQANPVGLTIDTIVKVKGGGLKGQADAVRLGIARALCSLDVVKTSVSQPSLTSDVLVSDVTEENLQKALPVLGLRKQLKDKGFLTQDSRVKERRKYGLKKARKATQYHKR